MLPAVVCWMMEAATAKETDTQKAKVFLTSAFGIRFAWLPSPTAFCGYTSSSSRREFLDIPQPSLVLSEELFLMAEPKENYWTTTTTTTTEMTKTHNGSELLFKVFAHANPNGATGTFSTLKMHPIDLRNSLTFDHLAMLPKVPKFKIASFAAT